MPPGPSGSGSCNSGGATRRLSRSLALHVLTLPPVAELIVDQHDTLRALPLQARDVASLAVALAARHNDLAPLWSALAGLACPEAPTFLGLGPCVELVQRSVRDEPRRELLLTRRAAWHEYGVGRDELRSAELRAQYVCIAPVDLGGGGGEGFVELEVALLAHRKHGDGARLRAFLRRAAARDAAGRRGMAAARARRRGALLAALRAVGVVHPELMLRQPEARTHVANGQGDLQALAARLKAADEALSRAFALQRRLGDDAPDNWLHSQLAAAFIAGHTGLGVDAVAAAILALHAAASGPGLL